MNVSSVDLNDREETLVDSVNFLIFCYFHITFQNFCPELILWRILLSRLEHATFENCPKVLNLVQIRRARWPSHQFVLFESNFLWVLCRWLSRARWSIIAKNHMLSLESNRLLFVPWDDTSSTLLTTKTLGKRNFFRHPNLAPSVRVAFARKLVFMHDNAPSYFVVSTVQYLDKSVFKENKLMAWPSFSLDLNQIENLWKILRRRVYQSGQQNTSTDQLWAEIVKYAKEITEDEILKLTELKG